jgi:hypothetical protein
VSRIKGVAYRTWHGILPPPLRLPPLPQGWTREQAAAEARAAREAMRTAPREATHEDVRHEDR